MLFIIEVGEEHLKDLRIWAFDLKGAFPFRLLEVPFDWELPIESLVGPEAVVPYYKGRHFISHGVDVEWNNNPSGTLVLECFDKTFNNRYRAILLDRSES